MRCLFAALFLLLGTPLFAQHDMPPTSEFTISGSVKNAKSFSIKDLEMLRSDSLGALVVRNKKGDEKAIVKEMKGVLLTSLLDSAGIVASKHREYSELVVILTASDGYTNVYSWNELYNTEIGKHVYLITEMDGKKMADMTDRLLVISFSDINSGRRHLKALSKIEVKKVQ
jgi:hypothetical protein